MFQGSLWNHEVSDPNARRPDPGNSGQGETGTCWVGPYFSQISICLLGRGPACSFSNLPRHWTLWSICTEPNRIGGWLLLYDSLAMACSRSCGVLWRTGTIVTSKCDLPVDVSCQKSVAKAMCARTSTFPLSSVKPLSSACPHLGVPSLLQLCVKLSSFSLQAPAQQGRPRHRLSRECRVKVKIRKEQKQLKSCAASDPVMFPSK